MNNICKNDVRSSVHYIIHLHKVSKQDSDYMVNLIIQKLHIC